MSLREDIKAFVAQIKLDDPMVASDEYRSVAAETMLLLLRDHGQALLEAVADAERYRWLRDNDEPSGEVPYITRQVLNTWGNWVDALDTGPAIDAMIDTARRKTVDGGGA